MKRKLIWAVACLSIAATATTAQAKQSCEAAKAQQAQKQAQAACKQVKQQQGQIAQLQQQRDQARACANEALKKVGQVREEAKGTVVTLAGPTLFEFGKSDILPDAKDRLDVVAKAMQGTNQTYRIEGFTDSKGSPEFNQGLSQQRADAVRSYLIDKGVNSNQIAATGFGEEHPIASNDTPEGRANNRRVEIVLPSQGVGGAGQAGTPTQFGGAGQAGQQQQMKGDAEQGSNTSSNQQTQPPSQAK